MCAIFIALFSLAGCVRPPLRHAASVSAVEVQDFDTGISRFDKAHRTAIADTDTRAARLLALANATDAAVNARVLALKAADDADALRIFDAATPPPFAETVALPAVKAPSYDLAGQQALLDALNKTAAKPTVGQNAELLLGFAIDVATKMKADVDAATPKTATTP
ncbi:hypothetical protein [Sphingobium subterraneum]|uniref:Lipoprotein n=1 Tax=Sphingobium subterraneum TaxID=627688 RepID=A0A841IXT3_9SPHN|nr:hypothetical protein [Sphingobium subterraneum]MBB6122942.1 hypothetical protein [Sphingobium subterraneum]